MPAASAGVSGTVMASCRIARVPCFLAGSHHTTALSASMMTSALKTSISNPGITAKSEVPGSACSRSCSLHCSARKMNRAPRMLAALSSCATTSSLSRRKQRTSVRSKVTQYCLRTHARTHAGLQKVEISADGRGAYRTR
eukprot:scaffold1319_cov64-Phaeocystis_antarctica.AAC.8